jgi:hypothetical protein
VDAGAAGADQYLFQVGMGAGDVSMQPLAELHVVGDAERLSNDALISLVTMMGKRAGRLRLRASSRTFSPGR